MARYRFDLLFNMQEGGWSEVWYNDATDMAQAITIGTGLAVQRQILLSFQAGIVGLRIVPLDNNGIVLGRGRVIDLRSIMAPPSPGNARDQYTTSIRVKWVDASEVRQKFTWMRGAPDDAVGYDAGTGKMVVGATWQTQFNTFKTFVNGQGWMLRYLNPNANAGEVKPINRLGFTTEGALRLTFTAPPIADFSAGKHVIVRKYRGVLGPKVNGRTTIAERAADGSITVNKWAVYCADQETMGGAAELVLEKYTFAGITDGIIAAFSSHKVGRPFFLQVGRSKTAKGCPVTLVAPASISSGTLTTHSSSSTPSPTDSPGSHGSVLAPMH